MQDDDQPRDPSTGETDSPQDPTSQRSAGGDEVTTEMIERRAFEISLTSGASEEENWRQAERELREEA